MTGPPVAREAGPVAGRSIGGMELHAHPIDLMTRAPTMVLNAADAEDLGVNPLDRVQLRGDGRSVVAIVEVTVTPRPQSVRYVHKKLDGVELEAEEMRRIAADIADDRLSDVELAAYVSAAYTRGFSSAGTLALTEAMTGAGDRLTWEADPIADKHSIGGVAGNRVTPVLPPSSSPRA